MDIPRERLPLVLEALHDYAEETLPSIGRRIQGINPAAIEDARGQLLSLCAQIRRELAPPPPPIPQGAAAPATSPA